LQFHVKVRKAAEHQKSTELQWIFNSQALAEPERALEERGFSKRGQAGLVQGHGFSRAVSG
jgi:hypothetical protein